MTLCKSISMLAAKLSLTGVDRPRRPSHGTPRLLVLVALAAMIAPLWGCGDGAGGAGGGSVDISAAKDAAKINPEIAKAAAARGLGVGDAKQGKKGR
jgi:hypothetical protein